MKNNFEVKKVFSASVSEIYNGWLNSETHSKMTGGEAKTSTKEGELFTAWDDYISGANIKLIADTEIIQSWRTSEFKDEDADSEIQITFKPTSEGTELTLKHTEIPEGQPDYKQGWVAHYFEPMSVYFKE